MSLAAQDKVDLIERVTRLLATDEPEAVIEELRRYAERQAQLPEVQQYQRNRWRALSYALMEANAQLNSPPQPAGPDFSPDPVQKAGLSNQPEQQAPDQHAPTAN